MPERAYEIILDSTNKIFVYFETLKGNVVLFVVKYIAIIDNKEYEIIRFDSAHDVVHIDILLPNGSTKRKVWLPYLDNARGLTHAQEDIQLNYKFYLERFTKWIKKNRK